MPPIVTPLIKVKDVGKYDVLTDVTCGGQSAANAFSKVAVAADTEVCAKVVKTILQEGGSVVDAAVAGMMCTGVINPQHSGVGGSVFMLVHATAKGEQETCVHAIDGRTTTPAAGTKEFYGEDYFLKRRGPFSVGLPAEVMAYYEAWKKFGKVPWARLVEPAINLCRDGYTMRPTTANRFPTHWEDMISWSSMNCDDAAWRELFIKPDGSMFKTGEKLTNHRLGNTLELIANDPMSFYNGKLAEEIVADLKDHGSHITQEDMKNYSAIWREPFATELKSVGLTSYTMPPPSCGIILHFILKLFERFNHTPEDMRTIEGATLAYHHIIEAMKFGFAEKSRIGDPDYCDSVKELMAKLCSDKYITTIQAIVDDDKTHETMYYNPAVGKSNDDGTTHLSIVGENGEAVALTGTLNGIFGSYVRGKRTGIIFNNENATFSQPGVPDSEGYLAPHSTNFFAPGKRPKSSKSPVIMLDNEGQVRLVVGGSGGRRITTSSACVLIHNLWLGQQMEKAINIPRLAHFLSPNELEYERGFPEEVLEGLHTIGHQSHEAIGIAKNSEELRAQLQNRQKPCISIFQAIVNTCAGVHYGNTPCQGKCLQAVCDWRKGGTPDGY